MTIVQMTIVSQTIALKSNGSKDNCSQHNCYKDNCSKDNCSNDNCSSDNWSMVEVTMWMNTVPDFFIIKNGCRKCNRILTSSWWWRRSFCLLRLCSSRTFLCRCSPRPVDRRCNFWLKIDLKYYWKMMIGQASFTRLILRYDFPLGLLISENRNYLFV